MIENAKQQMIKELHMKIINLSLDSKELEYFKIILLLRHGNYT
jgi:hypothetical protein